jgi:ATP-dependent RNA helicase DDX41
MSERARQELRDAMFISCEGTELPAPITHFEEMKLPKGILRHLTDKNISKPSPIQMQGLPVALSGRCGARAQGLPRGEAAGPGGALQRRLVPC